MKGRERLIWILVGIAFVAFLVLIITKGPKHTCVTHVPDSRNGISPCDLGAHVEVVDHVALCVCPPAPPRTGASDGDE